MTLLTLIYNVDIEGIEIVYEKYYIPGGNKGGEAILEERNSKSFNYIFVVL